MSCTMTTRDRGFPAIIPKMIMTSGVSHIEFDPLDVLHSNPSKDRLNPDCSIRLQLHAQDVGPFNASVKNLLRLISVQSRVSRRFFFFTRIILDYEGSKHSSLLKDLAIAVRVQAL